MFPDQVGVRPCRIDERFGNTPRLVVSLRTLQSEFTPVLGREVSECLLVIKPCAVYLPDQGL